MEPDRLLGQSSESTFMICQGTANQQIIRFYNNCTPVVFQTIEECNLGGKIIPIPDYFKASLCMRHCPILNHNMTATYFPIARYDIKNLSVSPLIYASIPFLIVDVYSLKPSYFGKSHHTHCCNVRLKGRRYLLHRCRDQHLRHQP